MNARHVDLLPELRATDGVVIGLLLLMVVLTGLATETWAPGAGPGAVLAVMATGTLQTVPALWRRERPIGALLVFGASVPVAWAISSTVATWVWAVLVYAVVRRARPLPGALAAVGVTVVAPLLAGLVAHPGAPDRAVGLALGLDLTLVPVALAVTALAVVTRLRAARAALRRRRAEHERLADALAAQRDRLAGDLRELVAVRVERVVTRTRALAGEADPGPRLVAIAAEARAALAGMRRALTVLRAPAAETGPAPAAAEAPGDAPSWRPSRGGLLLGAGMLALVALSGAAAAAAAPALEPGSPATASLAVLDVDPTRPLALVPLVVQALALGWWRRAPLPALVVATAASTAAGLLGSTHLLTEASWGVIVFGAGLAAGTTAATVVSAVVVTACTAAVLVTTTVIGMPAGFGGDRWTVAVSYLLVPAVWGLGVLQRRSAQAEARRAAARAADEAARAVHAQRLGLARELHDVLAHELSALVVTVHAARVAPEPATLATITEEGERIATALPTLLAGLGPGVASGDAAEHIELDATALAALAAPVREAGLPVTVTVAGTAPSDRPEADVIAAQIVTEALTNTLRHAGPTPTRVAVRHDDEAVTVEVTDDGPRPGHRAVAEGSGLGFVGMRERAALVGGTVEAGPHGPGWRVAARLPRRDAGVLGEEEGRRVEPVG
ncbi:sensor histidine kinase [Actinomycetospora straminea]|uniref:histidine kinase n=1 Tax=Actinomycetospora straminea TaxID=663607 RepID=A0ABP9F6G7_9PSEU|nr:ATP-binding protein [Actinomycetospora straminea]MDD7931614.1 histidine kinase [Actinomycetospora straminea]